MISVLAKKKQGEHRFQLRIPSRIHRVAKHQAARKAVSINTLFYNYICDGLKKEDSEQNKIERVEEVLQKSGIPSTSIDEVVLELLSIANQA